MTIKIKWADGTLKRFGSDLDRLHREFPVVLPRIVNQVGDRAKTQVIRNLTKQTGLPRKTIVKAVGDPSRASANGKLSYEMTTRGGNVRLKYLAPRETRRGVTAMPWGRRQLFESTFLKGGMFPNRVEVPAFDGHVYQRVGYGKRRDGTVGWKLTQVRSGMTIPDEMTVGATKAAFDRIALPLLEQRIDAAIRRLFK